MLTFDGRHEDYYTPGEYWLVKSAAIKIQVKFESLPMTNGLAVVKALAIGGDFLGGRVLTVGLMDAAESAKAWYDGAQVLNGYPSSFKSGDGLVDIKYNNDGQVMQPAKMGMKMHVLHITLPNSVTLQVNEWNEPSEGPYMNIKLRMPCQPEQDGYCGNCNGNENDDMRLLVRERIGKTGVSQEDMMFPWQKTTIPRPDTSDCPVNTLGRAKEQCRQTESTFFPHPQCLYRECFKLAGQTPDPGMLT
jgi:hypothetical protein